jgi:hypothetical protein
VVDDDFRNLYLVAGIRGSLRLRRPVPVWVDVDLLHILDRWGIPAPWGPCDSGADLETPGKDVVRGWAHVDLRGRDTDPDPNDVPISGLIRTMWDALELQGTPSLTGIDAWVPLVCAGERMSNRIAMGMLDRDSDNRESSQRALIEVGPAWAGQAAIEWDPALTAQLAELVEVESGDGVPRATYPVSDALEQPFRAPETDPFRLVAHLPQWSIDYAAWLAEVVSISCRGVGITTDVQIAVRLLH